MALLPHAKAAEEAYASVTDLFAVEDRSEIDVRVPHWMRPDKKPVLLRLRALSLDDRNWINKTAGVGEKRDEKLFVLASLYKGIIKPTGLSWAQVQLLGDKNERILELLADTIWELSSLDQDAINAFVLDLAGESEDDGSAADAVEPTGE